MVVVGCIFFRGGKPRWVWEVYFLTGENRGSCGKKTTAVAGEVYCLAKENRGSGGRYILSRKKATVVAGGLLFRRRKPRWLHEVYFFHGRKLRWLWAVSSFAGENRGSCGRHLLSRKKATVVAGGLLFRGRKPREEAAVVVGRIFFRGRKPR